MEEKGPQTAIATTAKCRRAKSGFPKVNPELRANFLFRVLLVQLILTVAISVNVIVVSIIWLATAIVAIEVAIKVVTPTSCVHLLWVRFSS